MFEVFALKNLFSFLESISWKLYRLVYFCIPIYLL